MQLGIVNVLSAALLLAGCAASAPPPATATAVDLPRILWVGTLKPRGSSVRTTEPGSPTGTQMNGDLEPLEETLRVPLRIGAIFGVVYRWETVGRSPSHTVLWRFPLPGIRDARSGNIHTQYSSPRAAMSCGARGVCFAVWHLSERRELIPGRWSVEVQLESGSPLVYNFDLVNE